MIKSSLLLICTFVVTFQSGYSQEDDFGGLLGPCVEPEISKNTSVYDNIDGKWYTHWVLGKYSPLKYFQCESNEILVNAQDPKVKTRFAITAIPYSFEWYGAVKTLNTSQGEYTFNYDTESILVMTKYQDPTDPHIDDKIYEDMEKTLNNSGISTKTFVRIDQYNCN